LHVAPITSAWTETGVSWNTQPAAGASIASTTVSTANTFLLVDVTSQVQTWLADPSSNFGLEITSDGSASVQLDSKENTLTSHPPALELAIVGPAGPTGPTGATGPTGPAGSAGTTGATGAVGAAGLAGPLGPTGLTGPTGPTGATGLNGAPGLAGALGPTGPTGPTGPMGAAGANGAAGLAGAQGPSGTSGPAGAAGPFGPTGPTGPVGVSGASGTNGPADNRFNMDTTLHGTYTIPDFDSYLYYLTNNPVGTSTACGGAVTITLPHSTVVGSGRMVIISPGNVPNSTTLQCPGVAVTAQSGDTLVPSGSNASAHPLVAISNGAGSWIIMNNDGR